MRVASTDHVELEVHPLGGAGPDLLLAHATGFHGLVWEPLAAHLDGYRRWSVDLRAHGDSTPPRGRPLEWEGFAEDVLAVVDALGLDRPFGVGHSKGGAALLLAEQARPGTFAALWLYEPVVMPPEAATGPNPDNPLSTGARRRRATFGSRDEAYANFASKAPFSTLDPAALRAYVEHGFADDPEGGVRLKCEPGDEADVYAHGSAHQAFAGLEAVGCPVTVAMGDEGLPPGTLAPSIAAALPDGRLARFEGLGHFGPLEDPARVAAAVVAAFAAG